MQSLAAHKKTSNATVAVPSAFGTENSEVNEHKIELILLPISSVIVTVTAEFILSK